MIEKRRKLLFRAGAVLGALVLGALVLEGLLWIVAPVRFHEWLIWVGDAHLGSRPMPNQRIRIQAGTEFRINRYGFRGPDYAWRKDPGTLRLEVFGGSAAFCYHNRGDEKTWPKILEMELQRGLGLPVEVINLAAPGFDVFRSKMNYLTFGRAFRPDAIVVYHTWNDMKNFRWLETKPYNARTGGSRKRPLWQRVARATQIGRHGRNIVFAWTRRELEPHESRPTAGADRDRPASAGALEWERTNYRDIAMLARADGVLPILVSQAGLISVENYDSAEVRRAMATAPERLGMSLRVIAETWYRISGIIEEVAMDEEAIFVDGYNAVPRDLDHLFDAVHLTDAGTEALGREIARSLLAEPRFLELAERVRAERPAP